MLGAFVACFAFAVAESATANKPHRQEPNGCVSVTRIWSRVKGDLLWQAGSLQQCAERLSIV